MAEERQVGRLVFYKLTAKAAPVSPFNSRIEVRLVEFIVSRRQNA